MLETVGRVRLNVLLQRKNGTNILIVVTRSFINLAFSIFKTKSLLDKTKTIKTSMQLRKHKKIKRLKD